MRVLIVDRHSIYRRGLESCLGAIEDVTEVAEAESFDAAWRNPSLPECDVVIVDNELTGAHDFIRRTAELYGSRVLVCSSSSDEDEVLGAIQAGAVGYLLRDSLTPAALVTAVRAAVDGAGVMAPELLARLMRGVRRVSQEVLEPRGLSVSRLTLREREVLRLLADGYPTREVADRLCYSERTIKNVIHDVVMKLNARTRSQAVAAAIREGLI